jgi:hypothetical protein
MAEVEKWAGRSGSLLMVQITHSASGLVLAGKVLETTQQNATP